MILLANLMALIHSGSVFRNQYERLTWINVTLAREVYKGIAWQKLQVSLT
jgi:hypothetical protein